MNRAVLLPTPCDPFLIKYWLESFSKWKNEVGKLYVCLNSPTEREVILYIQDLLDKYGANYIYIDHQIEHGDAINRLLDMVTEDYVMLIEDDAFVFKTGLVDSMFKLVETEYDIVGSKRGSCGFEILNRAKDIWGVDCLGVGDHGCNFWPNFFFCKTQTLLDTDRNFSAKQWKAGEIIEALGCSFDVDVCGDTFVNTSLQLRAKGLKICHVPQYHGNTSDIEDHRDNKNLFDGKSGWTHIGSLSSGVGGVLVDDQGRSLARRLIDPPKEFTLPPADINEWARRLQWWQTFYDNSDPDKITEFRDEYKKALDRLYITSGVHRKTVLKRQKIYKELGV
jgi:hypothetical protein